MNKTGIWNLHELQKYSLQVYKPFEKNDYVYYQRLLMFVIFVIVNELIDVCYYFLGRLTYP